MESVINFSYIVASALFITGLKMLSRPDTARRGNMVSAVGMLIAVLATLATKGLGYQWILAAAAIGGAIGLTAARLVKMTAMPEMVGLFNGFGGLASFLVGWAEYDLRPDSPTFTLVAIFATVLIGGVTFSGSIIAFAKLAEWMTGRPVLFTGQKAVSAVLLLAAFGLGAAFVLDAPEMYAVFIAVMALALVLGVLLTIPVGGADMPVMIALLNSYSGLAACAAGFVIMNTVLIVAGSLVGASGLILTNIMCKAMNRSLANVMFAGVGAARETSTEYQGEPTPVSPEDTYLILEAARSVIFVPGYGMAVAQAQHAVRELGELLQANGAEVKYVIHPVAGRMPGHMNVLLAEANVPYEALFEPEDVNPSMDICDVAIVIGANDVVNPAAREDKSSPLWGMPIIDVDYARTCIVLKRSMNPGFAGVENPLFFKPNTRMLFGDAKATLSKVVAEFKEG